MGDRVPTTKPSLSRRRVLQLGGLAGGAAVLNVAGLRRWGDANAATPTWHDPATWGGRVPGPGDQVTLSSSVVLDADAVVDGLVVDPGGALIFDSASSVGLQSTANVVVKGAISMRPSGLAVHRLSFTGVNEGAFVGGGMDVLASDVGLWVMEDGVLDVQGASKTAWTRANESLDAGATSLTVQSASGWQVGDELVLTPTVPVTTAMHHAAYDRLRIAAISGSTVTLAGPTAHHHPVVTVAGVSYGCEVLNLTRTVRIEGAAGANSHVFIRSNKPQYIRYLEGAHLGPRKGGPEAEKVLGRYGVHFHHCFDGSRGSVVEGVVLRDTPNHAFVPHFSNGVTFLNCVSHDTQEDAYWWDLRARDSDGGTIDHISNDITYDRCVASKSIASPEGEGHFSHTGFLMAEGTGNKALGCVAVGQQGSAESNGFHWSASSRPSHWTFDGCLAHNILGLAMRVWQNDGTLNVMQGFSGYHCSRGGVSAGAYSNAFKYLGGAISACGGTEQVLLRAQSNRVGQHTLAGTIVDAAGQTDWAVRSARFIADENQPRLVENNTLQGGRLAQFNLGEANHATTVLFRNNTVVGNAFWIDDTAHVDSSIVVTGGDLGSFTLQHKSRPGAFVPEWNASRTDVVAPPPPVPTPDPGPVPGPPPPDSTTTTRPPTTTTSSTAPPSTTTTVMRKRRRKR